MPVQHYILSLKEIFQNLYPKQNVETHLHIFEFGKLIFKF